MRKAVLNSLSELVEVRVVPSVDGFVDIVVHLGLAPAGCQVVLIQHAVVAVSDEDLHQKASRVGVSQHSRAERKRVRLQVAVAFWVDYDIVADVAGTVELVVNPLVKPE